MSSMLLSVFLFILLLFHLGSFPIDETLHCIYFNEKIKLVGQKAMATKKVIAICQSGGEFVTNKDGSLSYTGGEAYAVDIDNETQLNDFRSEIADMFNCNADTMTIKYFLPGNKRTLITISKDKDLQRMVSFLGDSVTADVFIMSEEAAARNVSNMPASRYLLLFFVLCYVSLFLPLSVCIFVEPCILVIQNVEQSKNDGIMCLSSYIAKFPCFLSLLDPIANCHLVFLYCVPFHCMNLVSCVTLGGRGFMN